MAPRVGEGQWVKGPAGKGREAKWVDTCRADVGLTTEGVVGGAWCMYWLPETKYLGLQRKAPRKLLWRLVQGARPNTPSQELPGFGIGQMSHSQITTSLIMGF